MAAKKKIPTLKFYADIGGWGVSASGFTSEFEYLASKFDEVLMRVHCYGGSVLEGNVIYNSLLQADVKTSIQIDGIAASMMALVMFGADEIAIVDNGFVMIHSPVSSGGGNALQLESQAKLLRSMQDNAILRIMEKTGKSEKEVGKLFDGNDHWFNADEALAYGIVDRVIPATVKNIKALDVAQAEDVGVESIYNRFAAKLNEKPISNHKNSKTMKKLLIDSYGLQGVTEDSTEAEVLAALNARNAAMKQQLDDMVLAQKAQLDGAINAAISASETAKGKIYEAKQRDVLVQIGEKAGIEALHMSLGTVAAAVKPTVPRVVDMLGGGNDRTQADERASWDFDKWQKEDSEGFEAMADTDFERFNAIYKKKFKADAPK